MQIIHCETQELIAESKRGQAIMPFEGNYYNFKSLGWKNWFPNPLLPFIWFCVAVPQQHPDLLVITADHKQSKGSSISAFPMSGQYEEGVSLPQ